MNWHAKAHRARLSLAGERARFVAEYAKLYLLIWIYMQVLKLNTLNPKL